MKVLNLLSSGGVGGIEQLCKGIGKYADYENAFCFLFEEGSIFDEMRQAGRHVISLANQNKGKFTITRWQLLSNLAKDYDIIVAHHCTIALQIYYLLLCKKYKDKKYVMTVHSCFEKEQNYNYDSWLKNSCAEYVLKTALSTSDKIIFVSQAGRLSYLSSFNIMRSKTEVVYNGIELPQYCKLKEEKKYYRLTYIGRLEKGKGIDLLLEAVQKFSKCTSLKIKLWIIGDGSYRNELEREAIDRGIAPSVDFLGVKRNIGDFLSKTDVFIYPSVWEEVFGISLIEAMSYGVPCISNRVGGIPEIIEDEINGYISETKTGEAIFRAICKVINRYEEGTIEEMQKKCFETAIKFDIKNTITDLKRVYEELLTNN